MKAPKRKIPPTIPIKLIAPCGMNCRLCWGFIREKNPCPGCRSRARPETRKAQSRAGCIVKNCDRLAKSKTPYCSESCDRFPCPRLKQLDQRYRTKYGMSMLENLRRISEYGIRDFVREEKTKWTCPECGDLICVHRPECLSCGHKWR